MEPIRPDTTLVRDCKMARTALKKQASYERDPERKAQLLAASNRLAGRARKWEKEVRGQMTAYPEFARKLPREKPRARPLEQGEVGGLQAQKA